MENLKNYYRGMEKLVLIISIGVWLAVNIFLDFIAEVMTNVPELENINPFIIKWILGYIGAATITYAVYKKILKYIDEKAWKKKFPQWDYSGE
ncbi:MAG: hypothetical protein LBS19_10615 [Clostridiales bacterium]|nr:hypothetical protein [Clostridiales bacterium]